MYYLPTYEQCQTICQNSECFSEKIETIYGHDVSIFNYRLADFNDFNKHDAFELRGLTFLHIPNGQIVFPMFHKFFNVNEYEQFQLDVLSYHKITGVYDKADGSAIHFIRFPDGKFLAKTKRTFYNSEAELANSIMEQHNYLPFLQECYEWNIIPLFELVSPFNKIVVPYNESKLVLTQMRDRFTGEYVEYPYNHPLTEKYRQIVLGEEEIRFKDQLYLTEEMLSEIRNMEGREGYVIRFDNGVFVKTKCEWYIDRHKCLDSINSPHVLMEWILREKIDDLIGGGYFEGELKDYVLKMSEFLNNIISDYEHQIKTYEDVFENDYDGDVKSFCLNHKSDGEIFHLTMSYLKLDDKSDLRDMLCDYILFQCRKQQRALRWLKNKGWIQPQINHPFFRDTQGV